MSNQKFQIPAPALEVAINYFNELQPLIFNKEELKQADISASPEFYLPRQDNPLEEMKTHLLNSHSYDKVLLTGHMGSGKSTELNRMAEDAGLKEKFFIVKYRIIDVLNISDIDYLDFLMSFAAVLFIRAIKSGIEVGPKFLKNISSWMEYITRDIKELEGDKSKKLRDKSIHFFQKILTVLLNEVFLRDALRERAVKNINQLLEVINSIIAEIQARLPEGKELLVIIDDLEKIPDVKRAHSLFNEAGRYMTAPKCKIVYTLPVALYYNVQIKNILNIFNRAYFLKNISIFDPGKNSYREKEMDFMRQYIARRMDLSLMDKEAQDLAIQYSGGVVRELMRIVKDAIIKALSREYPAIPRELVQEVIIDLQNEYSRGLMKRHYDVIDQILNKSVEYVEDEETLMELYHTRVLLEYENGVRWVDVNPIVKRIIKK